jgi:hypothetical protein
MASTKLVEFLKELSADDSLLRQWETQRETLIARAKLPEEDALLLKGRDADGLRSLISTMNSEVPLT